MKNILITGGAGFIGSNFVRYLFEKYINYRITILDALTYAGNIENIPDNIKEDKRYSFWYGNIRNSELVCELVSKSDIVVHFAAESHVARSIYDNTVFFETDVLGTQVVANAVLKYQDSIDRFIHISTSEVYGTAETVPMTESHPLNPASPYAAAKAGADRLVYSYWTTYNIPAVIIRPFNQYGPNQHLEKAIPRFITSALIDEPLTVHGAGDNSRDWTYVTDLCRALDLVMHADLNKIKGQVFNVGSGSDLTILSIVEDILQRLNKPRSLITNVSDRPGQVKRHYACTDKIRDVLGWKPEISFDQGITSTIEWYKNNPEWWKKQLWMRHVPVKTRDGKIEYH